jgi:hypothetical protein
MPRAGNNPKRRIALADALNAQGREELANRLVYSGSGHHKRFPGNYNFIPPVSPRPSKSVCDGLRAILLQEAQQLFRRGVLNGFFSEFADDELPKYVWCVDEDGEVYEAKVGADGSYHGYRLEEEDSMRDYVKAVWKQRCRQAGQ